MLFSCQPVFEDSVQVWLVVVVRGCSLHLEFGLAVPDLQAGDVVMEPGLFVHEVPGYVWFLDAGQAGEGLADARASPGPPEAHDEAFRESERVSQGGAGRLVDGGLYAIAEVHFGQVAVVHISGEDRDGGGRAAFRTFTRGDGAQQVGEVGEGLVEGRPVLEVDELAYGLA